MCKHSAHHIPDGENLSKVKVIIIDLSDKDGCQGLIQSCAIHVYGGADREHETGHALVHLVVFLQAFKSDGQCGRTWGREGGWKKHSKAETGKNQASFLDIMVNRWIAATVLTLTSWLEWAIYHAYQHSSSTIFREAECILRSKNINPPFLNLHNIQIKNNPKFDLNKPLLGHNYSIWRQLVGLRFAIRITVIHLCLYWSI